MRKTNWQVTIEVDFFWIDADNFKKDAASALKNKFGVLVPFHQFIRICIDFSSRLWTVIAIFGFIIWSSGLTSGFPSSFLFSLFVGSELKKLINHFFSGQTMGPIMYTPSIKWIINIFWASIVRNVLLFKLQ